MSAPAELYWPPLKKLYDGLVGGQALRDPSELQALGKYRKCLADGLALFKPKDAASRKAVQEGQLLFGSSPKVPVLSELREPALRLSEALVGLPTSACPDHHWHHST